MSKIYNFLYLILLLITVNSCDTVESGAHSLVSAIFFLIKIGLIFAVIFGVIQLILFIIANIIGKK